MATVHIRRFTGASSAPVGTQITSANTVANAVDSHQVVGSTSTDPIRIPTSGTNYSYWVVTRLNCTVAASNSINNIKWYANASNGGTGVGVIGNDASAYIQAVGTQGTTGTPLSTSAYGSLSAAPVSVFTWNQGAPKSIGGSLGTGTGDFGSFFVYQVTIGTDAQPGVTGQNTFNWTYDET